MPRAHVHQPCRRGARTLNKQEPPLTYRNKETSARRWSQCCFEVHGQNIRTSLLALGKNGHRPHTGLKHMVRRDVCLNRRVQLSERLREGVHE